MGVLYATVAGRFRAGSVAIGRGGHVTWLATSAVERDAGFGATLATGDFNGDHCADLAVGVPDHAPPRPSADGTGAVYVYYGSPGGVRPGGTLSVRDLGRRPGADRFGAALAVGDLDRDGRADLVVGAPGLAEGGGVGVFTRGLRTRRLVTQRTSLGRPAGRTSPTDGFGSALAVGRFDRRGRRELAVGAPGDGHDSSGAVTVLELAGHRSRRITQDSRGVRGAPERYDEFGAAVAAVDVDHDGVHELAVGAPGEDHGTGENNASGAVHVLSAAGRDQVWTHRRGGAYDRFGATLAADAVRPRPARGDRAGPYDAGEPLVLGDLPLDGDVTGRHAAVPVLGERRGAKRVHRTTPSAVGSPEATPRGNGSPVRRGTRGTTARPAAPTSRSRASEPHAFSAEGAPPGDGTRR